MILHPHDWEEWVLMVTVRNRLSNMTFLLEHVSQDEFFETYFARLAHEDPRNRIPIEIQVLPITENVFLELEAIMQPQNVLRG
jgi:hypothetical protein